MSEEESGSVKLAKALGFTPERDESDDEFVKRTEWSLRLISADPVTLGEYCRYAEAYAGRGAHVTGYEAPYHRLVLLTIHVPHRRRLTAWQRRRIQRRVSRAVNEVRALNLIVEVEVP